MTPLGALAQVLHASPAEGMDPGLLFSPEPVMTKRGHFFQQSCCVWLISISTSPPCCGAATQGGQVEPLDHGFQTLLGRALLIDPERGSVNPYLNGL